MAHGVTMRVPVPTIDIDDSSKLRERWHYYTKRPADLAALTQRDRELAAATRQARAARLTASWLYGEEQPDV